MTVRQAAEQLEVSETTIYDLCRAGLLEHLRIGTGRGTIRIEAAAIERYKTNARRTVQVAPAPAERSAALKHFKVRAR